MALGNSSAPTATLFINKESVADAKVNRKIRRISELAPAAASRCPSQSITPLAERVWVRINNPINVTTTGWLKPEMASRVCCGELAFPKTPIPRNWAVPNTTIINNAARSTRQRPAMTSESGMTITAATKYISMVIDQSNIKGS